MVGSMLTVFDFVGVLSTLYFCKVRRGQIMISSLILFKDHTTAACTVFAPRWDGTPHHSQVKATSYANQGMRA